MATQNPNWPLIEEALSLSSGPLSAQPAPYWVSVGSERSTGTFSTSRGRSYEQDQIQTGTAATTWRNKDGALDPNNTTSPFYPNVIPYRGYRRRAQYPATINLLMAAQATAGAVANDDGTTVALGSLPELVAAGGIYALTTTTGPVYSTSLPSSPVNGTVLTQITGWSVPGPHADGSAADTITLQAKVTASVSTSLKLAIVWVDVNGNPLSTTTGTPASVTTATTLTVTGTPPTGCAGAIAELVLNSSPGSASTVTSVNWQIERNATASSYVQPNTWFSIFTGFVERFPLTWIAGGMYGMSAVTCVDVFGWLSQQTLYSPAYMQMLTLGPNFLYCLDEEDTATTFADATGNRALISPVYMNGGGPANVSPGNELVNPTEVYGVGGPVVTFAPAGTAAGATGVLNLTLGDPTGPSLTTAFTRIFAFRCATAPNSLGSGGGGTIWSTTASISLLQNVGYSIDCSQGFLSIIAASAGGNHSASSAANTVIDTNWHLCAITMSADGLTMQGLLDVGGVYLTRTNATDMRPQAFQLEYLGCALTGVNQPFAQFPGDMMFVAELPYVISSSQWTALFSVFAFGGSGDGTASTATRFADILSWIQYQGLRAVDNYQTGECNAYGPATEFYATRTDDGTDVVSALQTVVDTEAGADYVSANGTVTLKSRRARYNQVTPTVTFGEHAGEIPYAGDIEYGLDTSKVATDAQFTQTSTSAVTRFIDATTSAEFGDIAIQRDINTLNPYEVSDAAQYTIGHQKNPKLRLETLHINVGSQPTAAVWLAMLGLELGQFAGLNRRPPSPAATMAMLGFVEQISWTMTDDVDAGVDLQISPQVAQTFCQTGSVRMNLNASVAVNATSMVVKPLADSGTNPIQSDISPADGGPSWVIDNGTGSAELVQINVVPQVSAGYVTATLGVGTCVRLDTGASQTGFWFTHAANALLQDIGVAYLVGQPYEPYITPANELDQFCTAGSCAAGY